MSASEKTVRDLAAPVPDLTGVTKPQGQDLTPAQQKLVDEVLAHFSQPDYRLPAKDEKDGALKEEEKFWLVRCLSVVVLLILM